MDNCEKSESPPSGSIPNHDIKAIEPCRDGVYSCEANPFHIKPELEFPTLEPTESLSIPVVSKEKLNITLRNQSQLRKQFPASVDAERWQNKYFGPAMASSIGAMLLTGCINTETFNQLALVYPRLALGLIAVTSGGLLLSGAVAFAAFMKKEKIIITEMKNRVPFSQLLTVSRIFIDRKSGFSKLFSKVGENNYNGFAGELHFVGVDNSSWDNIKTGRDVIRDGLTGLIALAEASKKGDERINGINYFVGVSPLIDHKFEKFGFRVIDPDEIEAFSFFGRLFNFLAMSREGSPKYPNNIRPPSGKSRYGVISRIALIENLDKLKLAAERMNE